MSPPGRELLLYGTSGCHLGELAEQQLLPWLEQGWCVELIDIADDDNLAERFALLIPVVERVSDGALLCWPFGQPDLQQFLFAGESC